MFRPRYNIASYLAKLNHKLFLLRLPDFHGSSVANNATSTTSRGPDKANLTCSSADDSPFTSYSLRQKLWTNRCSQFHSTLCLSGSHMPFSLYFNIDVVSLRSVCIDHIVVKSSHRSQELKMLILYYVSLILNLLINKKIHLQ